MVLILLQYLRCGKRDIYFFPQLRYNTIEVGENMKYSRSGIFLIVAAIVALLLGVGVAVLGSNVLADSHFSIPSPTSPTPQHPQTTSKPADGPKEPDSFVLSMVGDCTLASSQYNNDYDSYINKHGLSWPFSGTAQVLEQDEFTLTNLECTFSDQRLSASSLFYFQGPASYAGILTAGSVEFATLGNNHTADFGEKGLADTKAALDAEHIGWAGAGDSRVYTTEHGLRIGVYCPGWTGLSERNIQSGIQALKDAGAELIIMSVHWGVEGSYRLTASQESFAHAAVDAGADIVFGTHPHVLQQTEVYKGKYIFYSLGNWSFGGNTAPRDRDTAIAQVTVTRQDDGTLALDHFTCIPCCLSSTAGVNDYRPTPYEEESAEYQRAMSKLDGTWTGADLNVDYSFLDS